MRLGLFRYRMKALRSNAARRSEHPYNFDAASLQECYIHTLISLLRRPKSLLFHGSAPYGIFLNRGSRADAFEEIEPDPGWKLIP